MHDIVPRMMSKHINPIHGKSSHGMRVNRATNISTDANMIRMKSTMFMTSTGYRTDVYFNSSVYHPNVQKYGSKTIPGKMIVYRDAIDDDTMSH